jgi:hypothetical protein
MKLLLLLLITCLVASCSNGKIDYRDTNCTNNSYELRKSTGKSIILINTSASKKIQFTLKRTGYYYASDEKHEDNGIRKITLDPGEEECIGYTLSTPRGYPDSERVYDFEIVGELIQDK